MQPIILNNKTEKLEITVELANQILREQFPEFAHLPVKPVQFSGLDNKSFRLGDEMLIRLPSAEPYSLQVPKEQEWLPKLAQHLSFLIPKPLALGKASEYYPWNWSIYQWLVGESANSLILDDKILKDIAVSLAQFLKELHKIDSIGGPQPGLHNYWRGEQVSVYDAEARAQIEALRDVIDVNTALSLWEKAIASAWSHKPVWIHGDFASGNILIKEGKLAAVIDFGCMGIGDPACDLVIAWTFLKNESRKIFKEGIDLDPDTWVRARGWALWKATFELCQLVDRSSPEAKKHRQIIEDVLSEYKCEELHNYRLECLAKK